MGAAGARQSRAARRARVQLVVRLSRLQQVMAEEERRVYSESAAGAQSPLASSFKAAVYTKALCRLIEQGAVPLLRCAHDELLLARARLAAAEARNAALRAAVADGGGAAAAALGAGGAASAGVAVDYYSVLTGVSKDVAAAVRAAAAAVDARRPLPPLPQAAPPAIPVTPVGGGGAGGAEDDEEVIFFEPPMGVVDAVAKGGATPGAAVGAPPAAAAGGGGGAGTATWKQVADFIEGGGELLLKQRSLFRTTRRPCFFRVQQDRGGACMPLPIECNIAMVICPQTRGKCRAVPRARVPSVCESGSAFSWAECLLE